MTYQELDQWNSPNYTAAANVPSVFGEPRNVKYITIHHWGDPAWGQTFEGVVSYLCDGNRPNPTSAHFIVEAGRSACIVSPDDAAWHAGSAQGNAESIGIECNPNERDGDYQTIGEVIAYLRGIYGDVPLVPHNHWIQTDCPGTYDLARLDAIARGTSPAPSPSPAPAPQEDDLPYSQWSNADKAALYHDIWFGVPGAPLIIDRETGQGAWPETHLASLRQRLDSSLGGAVNGIPAAVLSQKVQLPDGSTPTVASILAALLSKPAAATGTTTVTTDPSAIATAVLDAYKAQVNK